MSGIFKELGGRSKWMLAVVVLLAIFLPSVTKAQTAEAETQVATPIYDVVSIVPNKSDNGNWGINTHDASFTATNISLQSLVANAYNIRDGLISGIPAWAGSARFDVNAKIVDPDLPALKKLTKEQRAAMLAAILAERFQLKVHTETKILPVYELVVLKQGPKFKESKTQDEKSGGMSASDSEVTLTAAPLASLIYMLAGHLHRTVIDKTGLNAKYDLHMKWAADRAAMAGPDGGRVEASDESGPSIFTALQEQLGLKLESTKGPVTTLVVDHAEPPSAN